MRRTPQSTDFYRDDDDDFVASSAGNNLAAIFESSQRSFDVPVMPKSLSQKKPSSNQSTSKNDAETGTDVVIAKPVHAFKLQNGQYISVGKLGFALTRNISSRTYQILLYQSKQTILSVAKITPEFSYTLQKDNYASYYDSSRQLWSIAFDNAESCIDFTREIGLSRYFCQENKTSNSVIYQDLNYTDQIEKVKEGDRVNVKFVIAKDITQPLKMNYILDQSMNVEISSCDNWEKMLIGACKDLRRIFILPTSKQISLGPGFPTEKDIALEVQIIEILSPEDSKESEIMEEEKNEKASLLSRMAKVGHSILPKKQISLTDSDDKEDNTRRNQSHESELSVPISHEKPTRENVEFLVKGMHHQVTMLRNTTPIVQNTQGSFIQQWPCTQIQPQYITMDGQLYSHPKQTLAPPQIPAAMDPNLNVFLSETRTQNCEIRMGMSKIADNVQRLLDKFHDLEIRNMANPIDNSMLEKLLALSNSDSTQNLQISNLELANLKQELANKQNEAKIAQDLVDKKDEKMRNLCETVKDLEKRNEQLKEQTSDMKTLLESMKDYEEIKKNACVDKKIIEDYKKENEKLRTEMMDLSSRLRVLESSSESDTQQMLKEKNKKIKTIMNTAYHAIVDRFTEETYTKDYIKGIVSSTIRNVTLEVLEKSEIDTEKSNAVDFATKIVGNSGTDSISISSEYQDEPPPIPPMDADMDSDNWFS